MRPAAIIAAGALLVSAYAVWATRPEADVGIIGDGVPTDGGGLGFEMPDLGPVQTIFDEVVSTVNNFSMDVQGVIGDVNVQAFLRLIRTGEGTLGANGYRTIVGGSTFNSYADHPRIVKSGTFAGGITWKSSAAGAYQFLTTTWDEMKRKYDLPDFSPASQDIAAVGLIKRRGALADVLSGRFKSAINKCNREWASLPGSPYGQPTMTLAKAESVLASAGGFSTESYA